MGLISNKTYHVSGETKAWFEGLYINQFRIDCQTSTSVINDKGKGHNCTHKLRFKGSH